jgi:hypothetical protein
VSPVKYELRLYIAVDDILHSHCRENVKSYLNYAGLHSSCRTVPGNEFSVSIEPCEFLLRRRDHSFACVPGSSNGSGQTRLCAYSCCCQHAADMSCILSKIGETVSLGEGNWDLDSDAIKPTILSFSLASSLGARTFQLAI